MKMETGDSGGFGCIAGIEFGRRSVLAVTFRTVIPVLPRADRVNRLIQQPEMSCRIRFTQDKRFKSTSRCGRGSPRQYICQTFPTSEAGPPIQRSPIDQPRSLPHHPSKALTTCTSASLLTSSRALSKAIMWLKLASTPPVK
jgi:hypothetical protein